MEKISSSETLRDVIDGMTVQGTVHRDEQHPENNNINNGQVLDAEGRWMAGWHTQSDGSMGINFGPAVTDRAGVMAAVETFIDNVMEEG